MATATPYSKSKAHRGKTEANFDVFSALSNPVRRGILLKLRSRPYGVGELVADADAPRSTVSEHLQVLRRAGLVREEVRGRERFYHLDPRPLEAVDAWLKAFNIGGRAWVH